MLLLPSLTHPFNGRPYNQGPTSGKNSEQNHKVLAAARISALDTGEKERSVLSK